MSHCVTDLWTLFEPPTDLVGNSLGPHNWYVVVETSSLLSSSTSTDSVPSLYHNQIDPCAPKSYNTEVDVLSMFTDWFSVVFMAPPYWSLPSTTRSLLSHWLVRWLSEWAPDKSMHHKESTLVSPFITDWFDGLHGYYQMCWCNA